MLTRREFIRLCTTVTAGFTLSDLLLGEILQALAAPERPRVLWVQAATCTGNTLSFANTVNPYLSRVITKLIDLRYHSNLSGAFGERVLRVIEETGRRGDFILIWEGAVPTREDGLFGTIGERGGRPWTMLEIARELAPRARAIIAVGVCATSGGPFAAAPNPAGCKGLHQVIREPVINCPGCPCHPDWFVGTLAHLLLYGGPPALDKFNRPLLFYGKLIHDLCPRRQFFDNGIFAQYPGDFGCLYKVGCKGPVTYADCPTRKWNEYVNWPVEDNTPCIGCANPGFPDATEPFFQHLPQVRPPYLTVKANTIGAAPEVIDEIEAILEQKLA
ncbi:MAG: hydrogenase small subunit, partial [Bacillota bacterium]|nr:hydrogenase small subunit [Bacillota bacterium]